MDQFPHRRRALESYVAGELEIAPSEIEHAEQVQEQWIGDVQYEIWDFHTETEGRWWVVTPGTNLYPQEEFKSADYTLTFHIGLTQRMMWKSDGPPAVRAGYEGMDSLFRQTDQAIDKANQVVEVADAQAAGVALRECLISLMHPGLESTTQGLKRADFVGRSEAAADFLAGGERAKRHRSYLKTSAKQTWQYVSWLSHDRQGAAHDAQRGGQFVQRVIGDYAEALFNLEAESPEECPNCGSRQISWDAEHEPDSYTTTKLCEACAWRSEPESHELPPSGLDVSSPVVEPCTSPTDGPGR